MKAAFLFSTVLLTLCLPASLFAGPGPVKQNDPVLNKKLILSLVNEARKKGCRCGDTYYPSAPALQWNDQLERAALDHSRDMSSKKYFSHTSPEGLGAGERIQNAGYNWMMYAENIGMGFKDEKEVVEGWLNSPGHCKNIMNTSYKEMGVGKVGNYWTQEFGSR
ncbi:MAG TPA: CAP domain-containing protein [Flavisolibacter sp.]|jgi:uncharacterized protein YkwD|nr:CAP domain-containing protein [Flavisolibacter sp.]